MIFPDWAMCGIEWDEKPFPLYPVLVQPKLNGVRAKWSHKAKLFISRQGKIFPKNIIPHLYEQAKAVDPGISIDGELYCHGKDFQTIAGMVTPNRLLPAKGVEEIKFFAFDIISPIILSQDRAVDIGKHWPMGLKTIFCESEYEVSHCFQTFLAQGFEGAMVRLWNTYYEVGRSKNLIKLKPWYHESVKIKGFIKGHGKLRLSLGALEVALYKADKTIYFKVGGGNITEEARQHIWNNQKDYLNQMIQIRYRETSIKGKPLQPQIVSIEKL